MPIGQNTNNAMPMYLKNIIQTVFAELADSITNVRDGDYAAKCERLSGATIGQHVRHVVELFQCLEWGYDTGMVNYEKRKRDIRIETDANFALQLLEEIPGNIFLEDKPMEVEASFGNNDMYVSVKGSYYRELVYNIEHTIHHMALIRVGLQELGGYQLPDTYGVSPATIQYRKTCAQ
jgi:hypothetical protein